jgi:hypothetical protein
MNIKSNHHYYTLYLEHLGGLIPLLNARKSSKPNSDFSIFHPFLSVNKSKAKKQLKPELNNETHSSINSSIRSRAANLNASSIESLSSNSFSSRSLSSPCSSLCSLNSNGSTPSHSTKLISAAKNKRFTTRISTKTPKPQNPLTSEMRERQIKGTPLLYYQIKINRNKNDE